MADAESPRSVDSHSSGSSIVGGNSSPSGSSELIRDASFGDDCRKFMNRQDLADSVLICGPERTRFEVHKSFLAFRCEFFCACFFTARMSEAEKNELHLPSIAPEAMKSCLEWIYCGTTSINEIAAFDIFEAADELAIDRLRDECINYLKRRLSPSNALMFLGRCVAHHPYLQLPSDIVHYVSRIPRREAADVVIPSDCSLEALRFLLKNAEHLPIEELQLFSKISAWVRCKMGGIESPPSASLLFATSAATISQPGSSSMVSFPPLPSLASAASGSFSIPDSSSTVSDQDNEEIEEAEGIDRSLQIRDSSASPPPGRPASSSSAAGASSSASVTSLSMMMASPSQTSPRYFGPEALFAEILPYLKLELIPIDDLRTVVEPSGLVPRDRLLEIYKIQDENPNIATGRRIVRKYDLLSSDAGIHLIGSQKPASGSSASSSSAIRRSSADPDSRLNPASDLRGPANNADGGGSGGSGGSGANPVAPPAPQAGDEVQPPAQEQQQHMQEAEGIQAPGAGIAAAAAAGSASSSAPVGASSSSVPPVPQVEWMTWRWKVTNSSSVADKMYSAEFEANGSKWRLFIFPRGNFRPYFAIYLDVPDWTVLSPTNSRHVKYKLRLVNFLNPDASVVKECEHDFRGQEKDWGFVDSCSLQTFQDPEKGFLFDDCFIVEIDIVKK